MEEIEVNIYIHLPGIFSFGGEETNYLVCPKMTGNIRHLIQPEGENWHPNDIGFYQVYSILKDILTDQR